MTRNFNSFPVTYVKISFFIFPAPKVYKSTSDYVTGLYNLKMTSRCAKKDAGTSMHREQRLDLTEKYVVDRFLPEFLI